MNREIKFRAWDKKEKRMLPVDAVNFFNKSIVSNQARGEHSGGQFGFIESELMQYTGLKDKNGKEIYEGDIVSWFDDLGDHGHPFVIKYNEAQFLLTIPSEKLDGWYLGGKEIEVIGNIYENPELLH